MRRVCYGYVTSLFLFTAFVVLGTVVFADAKVAAIAINSANIPANIQSHNEGSTSVWNNYRCRNPSDGVDYGGAYHSWISLAGNPLAPPSMSANASYVDLQINWVGNHCTVNMNTPTNAPPGPSSQLNSRVLSIAKANMFNLASSVGTIEDNLQPGDIGQIFWETTYLTPPNELYYTTIASKRFRLSGLGGLSVGEHPIVIAYNNRAVLRYTDGTHQCVNPNRPIANDLEGNLPGGGLCPVGGNIVDFVLSVAPRPVTCSISISTPLGAVTPGSQFTVSVTITNNPGYTYSTAGNHRFLAGVTTDSTTNWNRASSYPPVAFNPPPDRTNQWRNLGAGTNSWFNAETYQGFNYQRIAVGASTFSFTAQARDVNGNNLALGNHNMTIRFLSRDGYDWIPHHSSCSTTIRVDNVDNGTCTIIATPNIVAGGSGTVTVRVTNTGTTTWVPANNYKIGSTPGVNPNLAGIGARIELGGSVAPGASRDVGIPISAPASAGNYSFSVRLLREGGPWFGTPCSSTIVVRWPPPTAHCQLNMPAQVVVGESANVTFRIWYTGGGPSGTTVATTQTNIEGDVQEFTGINIPGRNEGNAQSRQVAHVFATPGLVNGIGTVTIETTDGAGGTVRSAQATCPSSASTQAGFQPYTKVYGGAVQAGGRFDVGGACTTATTGRGGVYGFSTTAAQYRGTASQFTIEALLSVNGAYSASLRTAGSSPNVPAPLKGLTLANDGADEFGGNFGGDGECITDYFSSTRVPELEVDLSQHSFPPQPSTPETPPAEYYEMVRWIDNSASTPNIPNYPHCRRFDASSTDPRSWGNNWLCVRAETGDIFRWLISTPNGNAWNAPTGEGAADRRSVYNIDAWNSGIALPGNPRTGWDGRYHIGLVSRPPGWDWSIHGYIIGANPTDNVGHTRHCVNITDPQNRRAANPPSDDGDDWNDKWICTPFYVYQPPTPSATPGQFPSGRHQYVLPAGNRTISGLTIPTGTQIAVYVDGDVYINEDITYAGGVRTRLEDIPNFALVVRGNIYVAPNVTRLDGLYIAQSLANGTKGIIYTCAKQFDTFTANELYGACSTNQLAFNGAVVARQVRFLRVRSTVNDDDLSLPNFSSGQGTQAGEVFNFNPEMYIAPSALGEPVDPDGAVEPFESVRSLPPVW